MLSKKAGIQEYFAPIADISAHPKKSDAQRRVERRALARPLELKLGGTIGNESPTEAHNFVLCVAESAVELDGFRI